MFYGQLLKQFVNRPYYLNQLCPKYYSNERVLRAIGVRILEVSLYKYLLLSLQAGQSSLSEMQAAGKKKIHSRTAHYK